MRIWTFGLAGMLAAGGCGAAAARQEPAPPPSGIVVHLFGQDSIMSNVLPVAPARPAGEQPAVIYQGAGPVAGAASPVAGAASPVAGTASPGAYVAPSMGDVLHQMFVTGDPNDPPQKSAGRSKDRLAN